MGVSLEYIKKEIKKRKKLYKWVTNTYNSIYNLIRENHNIYKLILKIQSFINDERKLKLYSIDSVKLFCEATNSPFKVVEGRQLAEVFVPKYFNSIDEERIHLLESPEIYIAELFDVNIIGENSFLLKDGSCLYDMFKIDNSNRYDFRFSSLKTISKANEVSIVSIESNKVIKEGIFLVGFAASNYYHLTCELLSKLKYIDSGLSYINIPILIDEVVYDIPQFKDLLLSMNKYNREIIKIKKNVKYKVERLIYPSDYSWLPINVKKDLDLKNGDFRMSQSGIQYIRETIFNEKNIKDILKGNLKLFISRRSQYMQRLINEKQISEIFEQYGFKIIYPEEMSFDEQVNLFSRAKYVAGTSGAALTNIIYCPKDATLICIIPKEHKFNLYSTIGKHLELKSIFLDAKIVKKGIKAPGDEFKLDINYCHEFLKKLES